MLRVPRSWAELTPAWMTAALARRCPGSVVDDLEVGPVEDGTNRRARVRLSYSRGSGPETLFVKAHGRVMHRLALVALGALAAEARLADSGVELPLEHPATYAAGFDRNRLSTIVVMEDITSRSGRPNDATNPLTVEQVRSGLEGLARLHAAYWERQLPDTLGFLRPWRLGRIWAPVSAASLAVGLYRLGNAGRAGWIPPGANARRLEAQFRRSAVLAASGPQTLLHGDPHPGNTYAVPGRSTGFYDWQLVRVGHWSHDVGYFLVGSLDVVDRRDHERELLAGYLDALSRHGVEPPGPQDAWRRYRATPAFGLCTWLHTLSAGSFQSSDVCLATIERFCAAYEDLATSGSLVAVR